MHAEKFGGSLQGDADGAAQKRVEGFDPEDLALEDHAEVAGDGFGDGVEVEVLPSSCCIEVTGFEVIPQGTIRLK